MANFKKCTFTILLCLPLIVALSSKDCDNTQCKGPLRFYKNLRCKPIYEKPGDCCAIRYDCPYPRRNPIDKCLFRGREYRVGEKLEHEDISLSCDTTCICTDYENEQGIKFACAVADYFTPPPKPGCYLKGTGCNREEICPQDVENRVKCQVEGVTYEDGQEFFSGDPDLRCVCAEGYQGENVAPFCKKRDCFEELGRVEELQENCAPIFKNNQSPRIDCSFDYRCPNSRDAIIGKENKSAATGETGATDGMKCKFGNLTLAVGDELNQATHYDSVCVKCVCEVPPTLTCQRLPDNECDVNVERAAIKNNNNQ